MNNNNITEQALLQQLHQSQEDVERLLLLQQEYQLRTQQLQCDKQALSFELEQKVGQIQRLQQQCRKQAELNQQLLKQLATHFSANLPAGLPETLHADYLLVLASGLFDKAAYLATNTDVAAANLDALQHYLENGGKEGRSCGAAFNSPAYLARYADVAQAGLNPLVHYLRYGMPEGRTDQP